MKNPISSYVKNLYTDKNGLNVWVKTLKSKTTYAKTISNVFILQVNKNNSKFLWKQWKSQVEIKRCLLHGFFLAHRPFHWVHDVDKILQYDLIYIVILHNTYHSVTDVKGVASDALHNMDDERRCLKEIMLLLTLLYEWKTNGCRCLNKK